MAAPLSSLDLFSSNVSRLMRCTQAAGAPGIFVRPTHVDTGLAKLKREQTATGDRVRPDRYYHVLVDIYERDRHGIDADAFAHLGRERGYDARGLGGFFVGSRAPLRRENGRVTVTTEGHRLLDAYLGNPS